MGVVLLVLALWVLIPALTYVFYWYEVSTPSCAHEGAKSEKEILERLLDHKLKRSVLLSLFSSILVLPVILVTYPFGLVKKWWSAKATPSKGTIVFIHGLFHNPSAALLLKRAFAKRGFSFISLQHHCWEGSIWDVFNRLDKELEDILGEASQQEPVIVIGHSLGGLLAGLLGRSLSEKGYMVKGVISLGTPFYGSRLASLSCGRLARSVRFGNEELADVRMRLDSPPFKAIQFWSPTDNMVLPLSSLYQIPKGWDRITLPPVCHTFVLFWPGVINRVVKTVEELV
ncbi:MAG: alpha/beta fold hydrolase [Thermodesulforhabdaceae bacterium]